MTVKLTPLQEQVLGYVESEGPVSVADVATSLLISEPAARSRLDTLERRGLLSVQHVGHHRGRGKAYVTTEQGSAAVDVAFGGDDAGSDEPYPVRIVAYKDGTYTRTYVGALAPTERHLIWGDLSTEEQTAVARARGAGGTATVGNLTVIPGRRLGVVEEWWK